MESPHLSLATMVRLAAGRLAVTEAAAFCPHGVTAAEAALLRELRAAGPVAPSLLADRLGMTRGAITKLVDRLKAKQYLVRAKGRGDGRMQTIALTGAGARLAPELDAVAARVEAAMFGKLDAASRAGLAKGLAKIT